jgi:WD40 repeat protein
MASALSHKHVFGLSGQVAGNVGCCAPVANDPTSSSEHQLRDLEQGEDTVLYCAGNCIVIYEVRSGRQRLIQGSEGGCGIMAMCLSPDHKLVAVAEKGPPGDAPTIYVYDMRTLRKRKVLHLEPEQTGTGEIGSMSFSYDSQLLVVLTKGADCTVRVWDWAKAKAFSEVSLGEGLRHCAFSPIDASLVCVAGGCSTFFLRLSDSELRLMPSRPSIPPEEGDILSMCWLLQPEDHVILGTKGGSLLLLGSGEYIFRLGSSPGGDFEVTSLLAFSQGFVAGGSRGRFRVYGLESELSSPSVDMFAQTADWQAAGDVGAVMGLALTPDEDTLRAVTKENQLLTVRMRGGNSSDSKVTHLIAPFHSGAILGMDVCVRKPLVATCGADRTVRMWNFEDLTLALCKEFTDEPHCISLHPSGLYAAIGFPDKVRIMNIFMHDMGPFYEVVLKGCREICFSHGGQYFAAAYGNSISVFHFVTREKIIDLRGHNSRVRHLSWARGDASLVSCGQDGAIYQWNVRDGKRIGEFVQKGSLYTCALITETSIVAASSDSTLIELDLPELLVSKELNTGTACLGQMSLTSSEHLLVAGTSDPNRPGRLRAYALPLTGDFVEYQCMGAPISRVFMSHCNRHLLVADEAGAIFVFDVRDWQDAGGSSAGGLGRLSTTTLLPPSDEVLITRSDMQEKAALEAELKEKVDELVLHNEYQLRLKDMNYTEKIKEITERFQQDLEQSKSRFELLREEKDDLETELKEKLRLMEGKHQGDLKVQESEYQQRIMAEMERYQKLVAERKAQESKWDEQQGVLTETHQRFAKELSEDFERKLGEDKELVSQLEQEISELQREFEETRAQLEDDIDTEVEALRSRFEAQLLVERESTLRLKGENGIMKKKFTILTKEIADERDEVRTLHEKEADFRQQVKSLEKEIAVHKREIKTCDEVIGGKEKRIYELKKKNQELEKFKFVLDFKIKELKRQIEPRENEISRMKEQIKEMDGELEQFHNSNAGLDGIIGELRAKLDAMQAEITSQRRHLANYETRASRIKKDLHECVQHIQEPDQLQEAVKALYQAHVRSELPEDELDANVQNEYLRHKEYLERNLGFLRSTFDNHVEAHQGDNMKVTRDNMLLVKEINMQREHNRATKHVVQAHMNMLKRIGDGSSVLLPVAAWQEEAHSNPRALLQANKKRILELRSFINKIQDSRSMVDNHSYSKEVLPPMDGVALGRTPTSLL